MIEFELSQASKHEIGEGVLVPERFTARFTVENDHTVELDIVTSEGIPLRDAIRVVRHPDRPSLTGHELRRLSITGLVNFACSHAAVGNQGGVATTSAEWKTDAYRADMERVIRRHRRRNTLSDDFLREVARVYRANADDAPVEEVKRQFGPVGHSTAAGWVKLARERGFLPKTTRGKVRADYDQHQAAARP